MGEPYRPDEGQGGEDSPPAEPRSGVEALVDELRADARSLSELPLEGVPPPVGEHVWP